jgi:2-keto-4-pentenoate hydratase/2-oxohepta-3-ene-1,7-dioic acid hydratase in catechol pathway
MKFVVFRNPTAQNRPYANYRVGAMIDNETIFDLTPSVLPIGLTADEVLRCYDLETDFLKFANEAVATGELPVVNRDDVKLEAPVPRPSKIICIGLNYLDHVKESGARYRRLR